jgi:methionyl-tRNA formyltransferase
MALNIIFMGTPDFAVPILKSINNLNHNILEVYTQPPNKKNRGQKIQNSPIHDFSNKLNLPVRFPIAFDEKEIDRIKKLNPDLVIVVAYGKILPAELLNLDKVLFINVHASLLPKWRGAAPIQRAIMNLDHETGVSIMKIVTELDAGPVLLQSKIKITKEINYKELSGQMSELGAKLILDTLKLIENKSANFTKQNESEATYAKKIEKTETKINWNDDAEKIIAKINAFCPNPGCWFELNGNRIKIIKAKKVMSKGIPGTILDDNLTIACSKNAIRIIELKKEGKQKMTADEFLRGNKIKTGQSLN